MSRPSTSKGAAPAYAIANAVIWAIYVALVLLVPQLLAFDDPVAVTASVLVAAALFRPLRRRASRAAQRWFSRRWPRAPATHVTRVTIPS